MTVNSVEIAVLEMSKSTCIELKGVRTHNLRNVDVRFPYGGVTMVTGVSGSGKSSLAFDTLYAESQLRFLESLSPYLRQFLEKLRKPIIRESRGLLPAMAIRTRKKVKNSRSTVGTLTEIADHLRLLFVRGGQRFCRQCGSKIATYSIRDVVEWCLENLQGREVLIMASLSGINHLSSDNPLRDRLMQAGYARVYSGGRVRRIEEVPQVRPDDDIIIDRVTIRTDEVDRLHEAVRRAYEEGKGHGFVIAILKLSQSHLNWPPNISLSSSERHVRIFFPSRISCVQCRATQPFLTESLLSFNTPEGACPTCKGFGNIIYYDVDRYLDTSRTIRQNPVLAWAGSSYRPHHRFLMRWAKEQRIPMDVPFQDLSRSVQQIVIHGDETYPGVETFFRKMEKKKYRMHVRVFLSRFRSYSTCPECGGKRLNHQALSVKIGGRDIGDVLAMSVEQMLHFSQILCLDQSTLPALGRVLEELESRLKCLVQMGVGYLSLDRPAFTLSGGEAQRVHLASVVGTRLADTLFVLDEPTVGLHPRDHETLIKILNDLCRLGNTVVCVEHDPEFIRHAHHIVEIGPEAGRRGGIVMYNGDLEGVFREEKSLTARFLKGEGRGKVRKIKTHVDRSHFLEIRRAEAHNLKRINVRFPLGSLGCITGVSGSGKSTLLEEVLAPGVKARLDDDSLPITVEKISAWESLSFVRYVDQGLPTASSRSTPVTVLGLFTPIRELFASQEEAVLNGLTAGYFSRNIEGGRCENCKGKGMTILEMQFLADEEVLCNECDGTGYSKDVKKYKYKGKTIVDVLRLTVDDALHHFSESRKLTEGFAMLGEVGLGYLCLGQTLNTLSGGEIQRLKLCRTLLDSRPPRSGSAGRSDKNAVGLFLLDEPTTGLHPSDTTRLLGVLDRLLESGHTIIVVEHDLFFLENADWVVDLGPEGGEDGGMVVYQGPVDGLVLNSLSHTGKALKRWREQGV